MSCIFCKIISREIPKDFIYEDDAVVAFLDIAPVRPGHTLVIPKVHVEIFLNSDATTLSLAIDRVQRIASAVVSGMAAEGCNITINNGKAAGMMVPHLHWHIIPRVEGDGLKLWSQGEYQENEEKECVEKIRTAL